MPDSATTPKTIQIFLPGGDPQGIRIAEVTTRIVQVIEIPRSLLGVFLKTPESTQVAVYFLIGKGEEDEEPTVYVGQTGDLRLRLNDHNRKKEWERVLVLISRTNSLTQTHALYLEWLSIQEIRNAGRFADSNGTGGSKPHTPAPLTAECIEIFDTGRTLLATLGYPLFDALAKPQTGAERADLFFCTSSDAEGKGQYTSEGFVVFKGSLGRKGAVASLGTSAKKHREKLIATGILKAKGDTLIFTKDHLFRSPSGAAAVLMGRPSNGWTDWKNRESKTLDEVIRRNNA